MPRKDLEKRRQYQRDWNRKRNFINRLQALAILGNKCTKCNINDYRCLQIDHIKPELRKKSTYSPQDTVDKIIKGFLTLNEVQLLCANCHMIKTYEDRLIFSNYQNNAK